MPEPAMPEPRLLVCRAYPARLDCLAMSSPKASRQPAQPSQVQALPLRSFTGLWIFVAAVGLAFVALAARSLAAPKAPTAAERSAAEPKGPTKAQVRERQEHIALTERALELARKERKAAPDAAATAPASPGSAPPAPAAPAADSDRGAPAKASTSPAAASPAAEGTAAAVSPRAEPPRAEPAAAPAPATTKPAAASGLDEMRADITSAFE